MLTTIVAQTTNPNQSGLVTSIELSARFRALLMRHGVDLDWVHVDPDGTITIQARGDQVVIGEEEGWITAMLRTSDSEAMIYEGTSVDELAAAVGRVA